MIDKNITYRDGTRFSDSMLRYKLKDKRCSSMSAAKRKWYSADFKMKVTIEAIKADTVKMIQK